MRYWQPSLATGWGCITAIDHVTDIERRQRRVFSKREGGNGSEKEREHSEGMRTATMQCIDTYGTQ